MQMRSHWISMHCYDTTFFSICLGRLNMSFNLTPNTVAGGEASVITPPYFTTLHYVLAFSQRATAERIYQPCVDAETAA